MAAQLLREVRPIGGLLAFPIAILFATSALAQRPAGSAAGYARASDADEEIEANAASEADVLADPSVAPASNLQPQPIQPPRAELQPIVPLPGGAGATPSFFGDIAQGIRSFERRAAAGGVARDRVLGAEATSRVTTDAGNLLRESPAALGVGVQRRTPIVNDPRVRGGRVGQLAASGSHWVPARMDLDTALSKIDSRNLEAMNVVKGPYSAFYGPGLSFVDFELVKSRRYEGREAHGSTSVDYKSNGNQWYGRQGLWGGDRDWGFHAAYGRRAGGDYFTGDGVAMPSGYDSGDVDLAVGKDLTPDSSLEFNYLRLDQNNVEYPGMAFDINYLVTEGYELQYVLRDQEAFDRMEIDAWYNFTRFAGDAQRPSKRQQFPFFNFIRYVGNTDVNSASIGSRAAATWGDDDSPRLTAGADVRFIRQQLDEIASGRIGFTTFRDANSPVPQSDLINPGLFAEYTLPLSERFTLRSGGRVDWVTSAVIEDPANLARLGLQVPQSSLAEILGTDQWDQSHSLRSLFFTGKYTLGEHCDLSGGVGYGQRPASLTELYAAQPFMFLLQNGQNTVTGDPLLQPEQMLQVDLGLHGNFRRLRAGVNGFYGWAFNYITFENLGVFRGPPFGQVEQVRLKFVNTDLATLAGAEFYLECDPVEWLTPFAILKYVEGTDQTRAGDFATRRNTPGSPSQRVYGLPRGYYSGIAGDAEEPLPGISPLESRAGLRVHEPRRQPRWNVELSARIVAPQERVAASLLESRTGGFTVWDIRTFWQATPRLLLLAGVENFTNLNYREHLDFRSPSGLSMYQPGVNYYFGSELAY